VLLWFQREMAMPYIFIACIVGCLIGTLNSVTPVPWFSCLKCYIWIKIRM
jgi:hypothetical protein